MDRDLLHAVLALQHCQGIAQVGLGPPLPKGGQAKLCLSHLLPSGTNASERSSMNLRKERGAGLNMQVRGVGLDRDLLLQHCQGNAQFGSSPPSPKGRQAKFSLTQYCFEGPHASEKRSTRNLRKERGAG